MKKCHFFIFLIPLIGSLWLINSAWAKTDSAKTASEEIHSAEISDISSILISLQTSDLKLVVFLNATGGLQGLRLKTQDVVLKISPNGQIIRQSSNGKSIPIVYTDSSAQHIHKVGDIPIIYTDSSAQHIHKVGDIPIIYTDSSAQHIHKVGDIPIIYTNTRYQHVHQVGNITIQYRDTSYQEIIQVMGNHPGVEVRIEK